MRIQLRTAAGLHFHRPRWTAMVSVWLCLLYAGLFLIQDLHHNHGLVAGVGETRLSSCAHESTPCPVELFQLAHGDAQPLTVFEPWLRIGQDPPAMSEFQPPPARAEAFRNRGPPLLS